jgi:hypothetical protein
MLRPPAHRDRVALSKTPDERMLASGASTIRRIPVYKCLLEYGGMRLSQSHRLRGLEREDELLRRLVADLSLANRQLKDQAGKDT